MPRPNEWMCEMKAVVYASCTSSKKSDYVEDIVAPGTRISPTINVVFA